MQTTTTHAPATAIKPPRQRIGYIHNFRGIAMMHIVAAHILVKWPEGSVLSKVMDALWQNSTLLFLFISGFLFQYLADRFDYKDYLTKKFKYVVSPYLVISIPLIAYRVWRQDIPGFTLEDRPGFATWPHWEQALYYLVHGAHLQQLWFIPLIVLFYIAAPLFMYMDKHPRSYYALIPLFIVSLIIPRDVLSNIPVMWIHFLPVYIFGMFISRYRERFLEWAHKNRILITVLPLLFLIATAYFRTSWLYDRFSFTQKVLFCGFFLYWLYRFEGKVPRWVDLLATLSFGIYFLHYFFVLLLRGLANKFLHHELPGNIVTWTVSYVLVMVLTVLLVLAVKRVLGKYSRLFIGA